MWSWLYPKKKIKLLHGNMIKGESGIYVAYFDEFPDIIAQGETQGETKERLIRGLASILERKKQESPKYKAEFNASQVTHFELNAAI